MLISNNNISIVYWNSTDINDLQKIANNYNIKKNMSDIFPNPFTVQDAKTYLLDAKHNNSYAIKSIDNKLLGEIELSLEKDDKTHVGTLKYWIGELYWGKGYATEAVKLFTPYCFEKFGVERIQAKIYTWNEASVRVVEKAGFEFEALLKKNTRKNGEYVDELMYVKLK
jgi:[ribosomal protein S5]-alanine N-acetyltransferase